MTAQTPGYGIWTTDIDGNRVAGFTAPQMLAVTQQRDELLAVLTLARDEVAYMASGMTHAAWKTAEAQTTLAKIDAAIQKATAHKEGS